MGVPTFGMSKNKFLLTAKPSVAWEQKLAIFRGRDQDLVAEPLVVKTHKWLGGELDINELS